MTIVIDKALRRPEVDKVLRRPEVEQMTGLSRSEIYRRLESKTFPAQVRLGRKAVGWKLSDIQAWIEGLQEKSAA